MDRTVQFLGYDRFDAQSFLSTSQVRSIRDAYTRDGQVAADSWEASPRLSVEQQREGATFGESERAADRETSPQ